MGGKERERGLLVRGVRWREREGGRRKASGESDVECGVRGSGCKDDGRNMLSVPMVEMIG